MKKILNFPFRDFRDFDKWALAQACTRPVPMSARQYFNSQSADGAIVSATTGSITTITNIFSAAQALQFFPVGFGANSPFAGQVYRFAFGGIATTGTAGTMVLTPFYGNGTANGVNLGASGAQNYTPSQTNIPWIVEGYLAFRLIAYTATASTCWCSGLFQSVGALATAGNSWGQVFGSTAAVSVDTSGTATAGTFGSLNFAATFSVASTLTAQWTSMQTLN